MSLDLGKLREVVRDLLSSVTRVPGDDFFISFGSTRWISKERSTSGSIPVLKKSQWVISTLLLEAQVRGPEMGREYTFVSVGIWYLCTTL